MPLTTPTLDAGECLLSRHSFTAWRHLQRDEFPDDAAIVLDCILRRIYPLRRDWRLLIGDHEADVVGFALRELRRSGCMPNHALDLAMTAVVRLALLGSATCTALLAHAISRTTTPADAYPILVSWNAAYGAIGSRRWASSDRDLRRVRTSTLGLPAIVKRGHLRLVHDASRSTISDEEGSL